MGTSHVARENIASGGALKKQDREVRRSVKVRGRICSA